MNIISMILTSGLAIGGYKYFKEKDFKNEVNEKIGIAWEWTKDTVGNIKDKVFKKK